MATVNFKGNPIHTVGDLPQVGVLAPAFTLTKNDLSELNSNDLRGQKIILNIFPSLDTAVCGLSVRKFNDKQTALGTTKILCVSADLPFAAQRFCEVENIRQAIHGSTFRHPEFGQQFGLTITTGPLRGLLARAVVVLDENLKVLYTEQVAEITQEPNYDAAITAITA